MTRLSARFKLRELLGPIQELADQEVDGEPAIQDAIRLLLLRQGGSEELLEALVAKAGLSPLMPFELLLLDEEEDGA